MKKVIKVLMYVYRENDGKKEFFVLHRKIKDAVILTGHVGDHVNGESLEDAAKRETIEELGVEPISIIDLGTNVDVELEKNKENILSTEHSFLIKISNEDVHFLEGDEKHEWHLLDELYNILSYDNQKKPLDKIKSLLRL